MSRGLAMALLVVGLGSLGCATPATSGGGGGSTGSGSGGGGGAVDAAPMIIMKDPSNYPQNTAGATFPFPQGHPSANCVYPIYDTDTVYQAYVNWKGKFVTATGAGGGNNLRVQRDTNSNDTVSEGIGYGMLIGVFMNDQPMFDGLWAYAKSHLDAKGLMTWNFNSSNVAIGSGSATDGDEDMAYALLMASKQWPAGSYSTDAMTLIKNIMKGEVSGNILEGGDGFNSTGELDPSYFAPSYYRAFAAFDTADSAAWMSVMNQCYTILANISGQYGLVPNWINGSGTGINGPETDGHGPDFGYDACRTPFRIGIDYCINNDMDALNYAKLIAGFYASKAPTAVSTLYDLYTPAGMAVDTNPAGMAVTGPGGVAAMAAGQDGFRDLSYKTMWADTTQGAMNLSGVFTYYYGSWGVLSLLAMSGNFWDMTQ
jgi:endo-1,4-beta-D-glucanase Y